MDWYRGNGKRQSFKKLDFKYNARAGNLDDPAGYLPSKEARDAVNVALMMRMPLLISGEPGSGKTQLGYAVANELGLAPPELFVTKSTTQARDLFYRYDALRHFHSAQTGGPADARSFIELEPLGRAIEAALTPGDRIQMPRAVADNAPRRRSLVIVDEIDKAPRDFPNDLLYEFDNLRYKIPELSGYESAPIDPSFAPILFITTNAEQVLPDAFVRRCAFLSLQPPAGRDLAEIIERRFSGVLGADHAIVRDIILLSDRLRARGQIERPPSSSEILQFISAILTAGGAPGKALREQPVDIDAYLPLLAKNSADLVRIRSELNS